MKKTLQLSKILVFLLLLGLILITCDEGGDKGANPPQPPQPPQPGANVNNPIDRIEITNLGTMTSSASGWRQLLNSIESTGKYINLDLSACTMTGTSFNPDSSVETGKKYIVSIILPTVATGIGGGFQYFSNLNYVKGANIITIGGSSFSYSYVKSVDFPKVESIGGSAFFRCSLENVNFPQVTTIGGWAFEDSRLKTATFPKVQSIGESAFSGCSYLENISFPASAELGLSSGNYSNPFTDCSKVTFTLTGTGSLSAIENRKALVRNGTILLAYPSASGNITMNNITSLDGKVFSNCGSITDINLPQVTSIGNRAFAFCYNIQDVNFPKATIIGEYAFSDCTRLQSANFPLATTVGSYAFYSSSNLMILNIPSVTEIESYAFSSTGNTELSITMGSTSPTLGRYMFDYMTTAKTVRVKVPTGATGYTPFSGSSVTVSGDNAVGNWANGFRGGGWDGAALGWGTINQSITLIIQRQ